MFASAPITATDFVAAVSGSTPAFFSSVIALSLDRPRDRVVRRHRDRGGRVVGVEHADAEHGGQDAEHRIVDQREAGLAGLDGGQQRAVVDGRGTGLHVVPGGRGPCSVSCRAPKSLITKPVKPIWPLSTVRSVMAFSHEYSPLILLNEHMTAPRPARLHDHLEAPARTPRGACARS